MVVKLRSLLLLLTLISSMAVSAESAIHTAYQNSAERENNINSLSAFLQEYSYEIQQDSSKIEFRVDSPVGEVRARFQNFKGRFAMLQREQYDGAAIVDINVDSLDTDAGFISMMLKSESFFDVDNFPSMRFVGNSFEWFDSRNAVLKGELTIQDVTRQVAFYVELVDAEAENKYSQRITVKATTTIKRSRFGMYTLLPVVSDDVNLYMSIDALKRDVAVSML